MLGKLTRWLRMLGQDVIYSVQFSDSELLELAKKEKRVLLTKDFELYRRAIDRDMDAIYIMGKMESDRLAEVAKRYDLKLTINSDKSYCAKCNSKIRSTPKEKLSNEVEKNTFTYYDKFWKCPNCGQIYWQGAHWREIDKMLNETQEKLQKLKKKN